MAGRQDVAVLAAAALGVGIGSTTTTHTGVEAAMLNRLLYPGTAISSARRKPSGTFDAAVAGFEVGRQ